MKTHKLDLALGLLVFVIALALRIYAAAPIWAGGDLSITDDGPHYFGIAISLIQNGTFAIDGVPTAYRMPFFPLFLAFWHSILGLQPYAPLPVFLIISALIAVGTYILGRSFATHVVALIAALLIAIDGAFILFSHYYMTETLFSLLVLASMLSIWRVRVSQDWRWAVAAGVLLAGATLTRANFGLFVGLVVLWVIWHGRQHIGPAVRNGLIVGGLVIVLWLPWVVRNYLVFDSFIPFTTQGGNAYYGIYNDEVTGGDPTLVYGSWIWRIPHPPTIPGQVWNEVTLDQYQREVTWEWIRAHPTKALTVAVIQLFHFWNWRTGGGFLSWACTVLLGLPTLIVFGLRRRQPELILWLALALTMSAMSVISVGMPRYQLPLRLILAVTTLLFVMGLPATLKVLWRRWTVRSSSHPD